MKITFNRDQAKRALAKFVGVERDMYKNLWPIAYLTAKDGVVRIEVRSRNMTVSSVIEGQADQDGVVNVSYKLLKSLVKNSTVGMISVETEGKASAKITEGFSHYNIACEYDYDVLKIYSGDVVGSFRIKAFDLMDMIRKTAYAVSKDDTRRAIQSVHTEIDSKRGNARFVGTDGRIMAIANTAVDADASVNFDIDSNSISILKSFFKSVPAAKVVTVTVYKKYFSVSSCGVEYVSHFSEEKFPNYGHCVPKGVRLNVTVDRKSLAEGIRNVGGVNRLLGNEYDAITLYYSNGQVKIGSDKGECSCVLKAKYNGTLSGKIALNRHLMSTALESLDSDTVTLHLGVKSVHEAVRITCDIPAEIIIMPYRIS